MANCSEKISVLSKTVSREQFEQDEVMRWAIVNWLEVIGAAAFKRSVATKLEFNQLPWEKIISARHFYVHHYGKVQWDNIWETLQTADF